MAGMADEERVYMSVGQLEYERGLICVQPEGLATHSVEERERNEIVVTNVSAALGVLGIEDLLPDLLLHVLVLRQAPECD